MSEYQFATESYPIWKAIVWCFYPMSVLLLIELYLRIVNDDDDDDDGGGLGIKVSEQQLVPVQVPSGA
tara:strand:+ start:319 stop:522 length:204 start_codon:yes stop_codon:yes gene_type:complete